MTTEEPDEISELPAAYQKAHKQYGIFAGLLFAWELIGVDVDTSPLLRNYVVLKSPLAVPYVLVALVLYFSFRFTVEWHQIEKFRRQILASRIDYWIGHTIALAAVGIFAYQSLSQMQLFDKFSRPVLDVVVGAMGGVATSFILGRRAYRVLTEHKLWKRNRSGNSSSL